jgi:hypothetical protein
MTGANLIASGRVPTTQRNRMGPPAKVSLDQVRPLISLRFVERSGPFIRVDGGAAAAISVIHLA